jgi:hypothetical protein
MKRKHLAALIAAFAISTSAHATLFCYDSVDNVSMTWSNSVFSYTDGDGIPVSDPGPQLLPFYSAAFCWVNGTEADYLYANFPNLRWPVVETHNIKNGHVTFRMSIQPGSQGSSTVYFVDDDAMFILNNL